MPNPWQVGLTSWNLSAYEPNQVFLNLGEERFIEIGYLTGGDSDGDGRGALVADLNGDLQPDLIVRQSGGGPLRVYANRFPSASRLVVSLEGTTSNRLGIGATVVAEVGARKIVRQLFPTNNFLVTQASQVEFGLGTAPQVDKLTVRWPSGPSQELRDVPAGMHIRITEGKAEVAVLGKK